MGEGNIGNQYKTQIENVLYVDGLKHNLLSISQLCDKGFKIEFNKNCCYCMKRGHTSYKCYIRRFDVPKGKCVLIPKDLLVEINPIGPNLNWVPPLSLILSCMCA